MPAYDQIQIKHRPTGAVLFGGAYSSLRACAIAAVKAGADLSRANLSRADLSDAVNVPETDGSERATESTEPAERQRQRAARFRERNPDVPVVEALDAKILDALGRGGSLDMYTWHKCETTHCRARWAITLAGEAGARLEAQHGPQRAGTLIYRASTGRVPLFYASDAAALEDIRAQAAAQASQVQS